MKLWLNNWFPKALIKFSKLCKSAHKKLVWLNETSPIMKKKICYVKDIRVLWTIDWPVKKFPTKNYFLKMWEKRCPILNEGEEESRVSHTRTHCGHFFCNKNFQILELLMQMKIAITLHVYLFLKQLIVNRSIVSTTFLRKI